MNIPLKLKSDLKNSQTSDNITDSSFTLPRLFTSLQTNNLIKNDKNPSILDISSFFNTKDHQKVNLKNKEVDLNKIWNKALSQISLSSLNGFSLEESYLNTGVNGIILINLFCTECGVVKRTTEDLEIHIKTEHLNWHPFQCPYCDIRRASDNQMREHLYSNHKKKSDEVKLFYIDNSEAKRILQLMLDKSFHQFIEKNRNNFNSIPPLEKFKCTLKNYSILNTQKNITKEKKINNATTPCTSNNLKYMENFIAKINETCNSSYNNNYNASEYNNNNIKFDSIINQFLKNPINNGNVKSEEITPSDSPNQLLLNNLFSKQFPLPSTETINEGKDEEITRRQKMLKKRVLGLCKRCKKPITAGSRQIHIFYHMAKEYSQYRFRCKHDGCTIAHYRKDQLESHHLKVHGEINVDMIEDRSLELQDACQELSMQLLGTCNNNPGPSAQEAQVIYDKQQEEAANRIPKKRQKLMGNINLLEESSNKLSENSSNSLQDMLECNLCKKKILSRIKGFHVLWHLGKEKGIPRYACKLCDFKHDRAVNVHRHTLMVHEVSNACEDMIVKHSDDMRAMSEACFGIVHISLNNKDLPDKNQIITSFSDLSGEMLLEVLKNENKSTESIDEKLSLYNQRKDSTNEDDDSEESGSISPPSSN
uniref:C2H2-type domain-containing protein n=1 Tax=Strongyloides papillosus TaxID=174720 RepID=A0A0N5CF75_STREA